MCNYRIYCFDGAGHIHLGELGRCSHRQRGNLESARNDTRGSPS